MVPLAGEPIFRLGFLTITNSLIGTLFADAVIIGICVLASKKIKEIPGKFQSALEMIIEIYYNLIESISPKKVGVIFPFAMTFFIFILIANWSGLLPGVGTIGVFEEHEGHRVLVPILRAATSDINTTLGLALVSAIATHFLSIKFTGLKDYFSRYVSLNPINLFVGLLEVVSEITKVISLSFRLYGNIFAGEVVLITVAGIFAFLFPLPFLILEIIVGAVQALVFSMLTMAFMVILTTPHHATEHAVEKKVKKMKK